MTRKAVKVTGIPHETCEDILKKMTPLISTLEKSSDLAQTCDEEMQLALVRFSVLNVHVLYTRDAQTF